MKEKIQKDNISVSIIIPVYNVQDYLRRCVISVLAQTLENYEIIIIDDGSTDNSGKICDELAKENPDKIVVIHQKNTGTSAARRNALKIAKGEYIGFVDSDDWIDQDMFKKLYDEAVKTGADVTLCDLYKCGNGLLSTVKAYSSKKELTPKTFLETYSPGFMVNKLYHKSLISKLVNTHNGCQAEDSAINIPLMCQIKKLAYVQEPLYYYYQRTVSASNSDTFSKNNYIHDYLSALKYIINSVSEFDREKRNLVYNYVLQCIQWGLNNATRKCYLANYAEFLQDILPIVQGYPCLEARPHYSQYIFMRTIPKNIIRFENDKPNETQKICDESIKFYTHDFKTIILNLKDAKTDELPKVVQEAYKNKNFEFVKDYLALKTIYEKGGIFIGDNTKLNLPLGELRTKPCFFGYKNNTEINTSIFGAIAESEIIKQILDTYSEDSLLNSTCVSLERRIYFVLVNTFKTSEVGGWNQDLKKDGVSYGYAFRFDKLSCKINSKNIAENYTALNKSAEEQDLAVIDRNMLEYWDKTRDDFSNKAKNASSNTQEIKKLKNKIEEQDKYIKTILNSASWKITSPIRFILDLIKKPFKKGVKK